MAPATERPTILVVDDSEQTRVMLTGYLEAQNFRVLTAVNGREGLELAQQHRPQLIVMDLVMPEKDGHEALDALARSLFSNCCPTEQVFRHLRSER